MLQPKRTKFRKQSCAAAMRGKAFKRQRVVVRRLRPAGDSSSGRITARQIEAARIAMTRHAKRGGKVWIRLFPDKPMTKRPPETRMGKGKGAPEFWVARVKRGRVIYEMEGVTRQVAHEALRLAAHKLPLKTRVLERTAV